MKKTINGIEYETFPRHQNIKSLGLDPKRKFIVCDGRPFEVGDIVVLDEDDNTENPYFKRLSDGKIYPCFMHWLSCYDEPQDKIIKEKDGIKVGDKVDRNGYKGYVAVIDPNDDYCNFILRLDEYNGQNKSKYWDKDWYPEHEKKEEKNCAWASKGEFTVVNENTSCNTALGPTAFLEVQRYLHNSAEDLHNSLKEIIINKPTGNKFMSNIIKFAKDLTLTPDEKEFRKAGLQNDTGWTTEAREIVLNLKAKSLNYKNYDDLCNVVGVSEVSLFEFAEMFVTYYDELLKIAKKFNKEDK